MNIQLKQKIIGIVVIVIFLAIAIPFLLSGSKNKQQTNINKLDTNTETLKLPQEQPQTTTNTILQPSEPLPANNGKTINIDPSTQPTETITVVPPTSGDIAKNKIDTATNIPTANTNTTEKKQPQEIPKTATTPTTAAPNSNMQVTPINSAVSKNNTTASKQNSALQESLSQKENDITNNVAHKTTKTHHAKTHKTPTKTAANKTNKNITKKTIKEITSNTAKKQWVVRVGVYKDAQKAQNLLKKLEADNYHATIQIAQIKGKTLHRVILEPLSNKEKAENLAKKVAKNFSIKTKVIEEQVIMPTKPATKKH